MSRRPGQEREARTKSVFGYIPSPEEDLLWMLLISCPPDRPAGASACTINGIAPGDEEAVIDVFQGTGYHHSPAGWDYVIKEFWVSFNQRCRFTMYQPKFAGGDTACLGYFEVYEKPVNTFVVGWTRSLLEDINEESDLYIYIKNEGNATMYGKIWLCGYTKKGVYEWI